MPIARRCVQAVPWRFRRRMAGPWKQKCWPGVRAETDGGPAAPAVDAGSHSDLRIAVQPLGGTHEGIVSAAPWALRRFQPTPDDIIQRNRLPYVEGQPREKGCLNFPSSAATSLRSSA